MNSRRQHLNRARWSGGRVCRFLGTGSRSDCRGRRVSGRGLVLPKHAREGLQAHGRAVGELRQELELTARRFDMAAQRGHQHVAALFEPGDGLCLTPSSRARWTCVRSSARRGSRKVISSAISSAARASTLARRSPGSCASSSSRLAAIVPLVREPRTQVCIEDHNLAPRTNRCQPLPAGAAGDVGELAPV
jgi:hypothetical protein